MMSETGHTVGTAGNRRILVVDEEKRMDECLKSKLHGWGYEVETAYSGRDAVARLSEQDFPVVITEIRMGGADGFELIRTLGGRANIAFIVITGDASTESAIEAVHHEVFDYITKPLDFDDLRNVVERAFAKVEALRFRDDMMSMITHDIKIPLSSIIGYSSLIFDKTGGEANPRAREFVQTIHSNSLKILSLIDNFLTYCKIEAGKLTVFPRQVNVNFIVEDLFCVFQAEIERNQLDVDVSLSTEVPSVMGDENLLFRAVSNAVSNACKYTPFGGRIAVRTSVSPEARSLLGKESLLIEISNSGPGIPAEDQPTIFDKFRRSRVHRGIEGSGIGLYLMRYVVEAHGGVVRVLSTPNELTTFSIFLPIGAFDARQEAFKK